MSCISKGRWQTQDRYPHFRILIGQLIQLIAITSTVIHMSNPHLIFATHSDRWIWDKYLEQVNVLDLEDAEKQALQYAYLYIRQFLGDGFLRRAEHEGNPIFFWYFTDASPGAKRSLMKLASALEALEHCANFGVIRKDIRRRLKTDDDRERLMEKMSTVRVAYKFLTAGFTVEFDPNVNVTDRRGRLAHKVPDLQLIDNDNGQQVIVEISHMEASNQQRIIESTFATVWRVLIDREMHGDPEALKDILKPRFILPHAWIHRGIDEIELEDIMRRTKELARHVRTSGEFGELIIPETIEICIAPYDRHELAREWARKRGLNEADMVTGAYIESDEIGRARAQLKHKLKQLPDDKPSVIVIEASKNLLFFVYDLSEVALSLAQELTKHPKLLSAIFYHTFGAGPGESYSVEIGPHTFVNQSINDLATQQSLIVRNTACTNTVPLSTLRKLNMAFGHTP
jgi:hypothetical protein